MIQKPGKIRLTVFTVPEVHKERRRIITWPPATNETERRRYAEIGHLQFPKPPFIAKAIDEPFAATIDLEKFFQQFSMPPLVQQRWSWTDGRNYYGLTTVPTGAVGPPVFAQILVEAMCALATRTTTAHTTAWIDNVRFAGSRKDVESAAANFRKIAHAINVTIGEDSGICEQYTFLGLTYDHERGTIEASPRSREKLTNFRHLVDAEIVGTEEFEAGYCHAMWLTLHLKVDLFPLFYVIKFYRRMIARPYSRRPETKVWNCLKPIIHSWINHLQIHKRTRTPVPYRSDTVIFTDASDTGYGVVLMHNSEHLITCSGKWTAPEQLLHINIKELLAVKKLTACEAIRPHLFGPDKDAHTSIQLFMDNTTAISWLRRRFSRNYTANGIIEDICCWLADNKIELSIAFIPSVSNLADEASRRWKNL